ncbi:myophilin-like [Pomacea canaliculata]|uniref:myophilin-like n=1 Tax=Pomacea canaliculata TaxID=400727 RepID=UPI000D731E94|nr:myophilin-like [Pomacea canaliculata]
MSVVMLQSTDGDSAPWVRTDAEVNKKIKEKYDVNLEQESREWIECLLNIELVPGADPKTPLGHDKFCEVLRDGQILCRFINVLKPGSVKKINPPKTNFFMMENIGKFLEACTAYGLSVQDQFNTAALFERTNMTQVVNTLHALGRKAQANGFEGPTIGVRESAYNPRNFSEETLREGQTIIGLQMGTNKGANQKGINFGKGRSITD